MKQQLITAPVHNASVCLELNKLLNFMASHIPYNGALVCLMGDLVQYFLTSSPEKAPRQSVTVTESIGSTLNEQKFTFSFSGVCYSENQLTTLALKYVGANLAIQRSIGENKVIFHVYLPINKEDNKRSGITLINKIIEDKSASQWSKDTAKIMGCWVSDGALITSTRDEGSQNHVFTIHGPKATIEGINKFFSALDDADVHTASYPQADDFLVINKKEILATSNEPKREVKKRLISPTLELAEDLLENPERITLTKSLVQEIELVQCQGSTIWIYFKEKEPIRMLTFIDNKNMLKTYKRINRFLKDHLV